MATYYVNATTGVNTNNGSAGAPWKTLAKANTAIAANDTVIITGTFSEKINISKAGTTWKAAAPGAAILDGGWNDSVLNLASGGYYYITSKPTGVLATSIYDSFFFINAADTTIDGLIMRNHGGQGIGIVSAGNRTTVRNCKFDFFWGLAINSTGDPGVAGNADSVFENNVITRTSANGITQGYSALWQAAVSLTCVRATFRNNVISHGWGEGIDIQRGAVDCIVEGNIIYDCRSTLIYVVCAKGSRIRNNLVFHSGNRAYTWSSGIPSEGIQIADETESIGHGFDYSEDTHIYNNIVVNCGLLFSVANGNAKVDTRVKTAYIGYNTFVAGPSTTACVEIIKNVTGGINPVNSMFENNIILGRTGTPISSITGGANYLTGMLFRNNLWSTAPNAMVQGTGDQTGAPNLVAPSVTIVHTTPANPIPVNSNNYKLTASSTAAIDRASAGTVANGITPPTEPKNADYFSQARGATRDIGASEYNVDDTPPPPPPTPTEGGSDMVQTADGVCSSLVYLELSSLTPYSGLRFKDHSGIPQGSTINSAFLSGLFYHPSLLSVNFAIRAEAADNPTEFVTTNNNLSGRAVTTATVNWTQTYAGTGVKTSPDFKTVIQEIVNRPGWTAGNFINLISSWNGSGYCRFFGNRSGYTVPQLVISFTPPGETPPVDPPPLPPGSLIPDPDGAIIRHYGSKIGYYATPTDSYTLPKYVVRAGPNQVLLVTGHFLSNSSLVDFAINGTYAGRALTLVTSNKVVNATTGQQFIVGLWKLDSPPAGMADIVMTADRMGLDGATLAAVVLKGCRKTSGFRVVSPTWTETVDGGVHTSSPTMAGCTPGGFLIVANTTSSTDAPLFVYTQANRRYSRNGGDNVARVASAGAYRYVVPGDGGSVPIVIDRYGGDATKMASIAVEVLPNTDNPAMDRYISYGAIL